MSQSSPDSGLTGASSNDATIITMQTDSVVSRDDRAVPQERASGQTSRGMRRNLRTFSRSTSPRTTHNRSPKKSSEKMRTISGSPDHKEASREATT